MNAFFSMGGFGFYVWSSFGITLLFMVAEPLLLNKRRKTAIKAVKRFMKLDAQK